MHTATQFTRRNAYYKPENRTQAPIAKQTVPTHTCDHARTSRKSWAYTHWPLCELWKNIITVQAKCHNRKTVKQTRTVQLVSYTLQATAAKL